MSKLNWNQRQSPTDLEDSPNVTVDYRFDYRRNTTPGSSSWPEKHSGQRFGPSFIGKTWRAGLVVVAEIQGPVSGSRRGNSLGSAGVD